MEATSSDIHAIAALIDRLRPVSADDVAAAEDNIRAEVARLRGEPDEAAGLAASLRGLLALPHQSAFYAETGIRSALGFLLELWQRLGQRMLPPVPDDSRLRDVLGRLFRRPTDHDWVAAISDHTWLDLAQALGFTDAGVSGMAMANLLEAARVLSYRLAGNALDRELLRANPELERHESPFLAQNAMLAPLLERARQAAEDTASLSADELRDIDVLLAQCDAVLDRVRRKAGDNGIGIRLTYLLARQRQLIDRLREILELVAADGRLIRSVRLMKELLAAEQKRHRLLDFIGENVSLLARNITDHASRQGEHYIAEDRTAWWAMAYGAAGGGVIIACMAMLKVQLAVPHLPPLTEGIAFGLNYGIGFVLIHLLGFTVATKQPAMTAAAIAATVEEAHPRELERLGDLAQNVVRTQFIAVLGNVGLALPVACLIALAWPLLFGDAPVTAAKAASMLRDMHPFTSGSLFFAAVAGVGLFLSGLVSGYFDNQARYHRLAGRIAVAPWLAWLGRRHTARIGDYLDAHYGAILGNLFFGMYLGLVGVLGTLTGLPVDIRHVAFSSANLGTALTLLDAESIKQLLPWAVAGVIGIALVNLAVSFSLALYVAMKSRRLGSEQMFRLTALMLRRFAQRPLAFFSPPAKR